MLSTNSILATEMLLCNVSITVSTASLSDLNEHTAAATESGIACNFSHSLVTIPNVPSLPTNNPVRLYPADDFLFQILS